MYHAKLYLAIQRKIYTENARPDSLFFSNELLALNNLILNLEVKYLNLKNLIFTHDTVH